VCLLGKEEVPSSNLGIGLNSKIPNLFFVLFGNLPFSLRLDEFTSKGTIK
jgi:hypothetical protein